jgi:hypothetical protein
MTSVREIDTSGDTLAPFLVQVHLNQDNFFLCRSISINIIVVLAWYRLQRIDEEEYGGHVQLASEGLPPSISLFMVS